MALLNCENIAKPSITITLPTIRDEFVFRRACLLDMQMEMYLMDVHKVASEIPSSGLLGTVADIEVFVTSTERERINQGKRERR